MSPMTLAADSVPIVSVYIGSLCVLLTLLSTWYGVVTTAKGKKRELELQERIRIQAEENEANKVGREEMQAIKDGAFGLAERWEVQTRNAWVEIDALKKSDAVKDRKIEELERKVRQVERELKEEREMNAECQARLSELEKRNE